MVEEYRKLRNLYYALMALCGSVAILLFVVVQLLYAASILISLNIMLIFELICLVYLLFWRVNRFTKIFDKRMKQLTQDCQIHSYVKEVRDSLQAIHNPLERRTLVFMLGYGYMNLENYEQALLYFTKLSKEKVSKGQRFQNDVFIALVYMNMCSKEALQQQLYHIEHTYNFIRLRQLSKLQNTLQIYEMILRYMEYKNKLITNEQMQAYVIEMPCTSPLQRILFVKRMIALSKEASCDEKLKQYQEELAKLPKDEPCEISGVEYEIVEKHVKRNARLHVMVLLALQILVCLSISALFFTKQIVFSTKSSDAKNVVELYKEKTQNGIQYNLVLKQNNTILYEETLRDFRKISSKDWLNDTIIMLSYVDTNYKDVARTYDFSNKGKQATLESFREQVEKEKSQTKKKLSKSDPIKTETGYKLHEMNNVYVTYDYGKHWKDTNISSSEVTFSTGSQLRLSDESYALSKDYSYFYYTDGRGYLNYTYSLDEGEQWNHNQYDIAAFDASWFQAVDNDIQHPSFFISDKNKGTLSYYTSVDAGVSFQETLLQVEGDINLVSDTSYVHDGLLFVSFYRDQKLYRSEDGGHTFEVITPPNHEDIQNFLGPLLQDGVLNMSAFTKKGTRVLYTSNDLGKTWSRI